MNSGIEFQGGNILIDIDYLLEQFSEEDCKAFIKSFSVQSIVIDHVVKYICGEDPDGWWTGQASDIRHKILTHIQEKQLTDWRPYNWRVFDEIRSALKDIRCKQHIYWALTHCADEGICWKINDWMRKNNIESNYTTNRADEDIARIEKIIRDKLENFVSK